MASTKIEKILELLDQAEQDIRKATVRDILIDLREGLKDKNCQPGEKAGLTAAIEIIETNY